MPGDGRRALTLATLTMAPPAAWSCITRLAAWATWSGASRLRRMIASLKRGDASAAAALGEPPTLLTTMSSREWAATTRSTSVLTCSGSRTVAGLVGVRLVGRGTPPAHHHRGPRLREPVGDRRPDAPGASGDERHLPAEVQDDGHRSKVYQTDGSH